MPQSNIKVSIGSFLKVQTNAVSMFKVAAIQMDCKVGDKKSNMLKAEKFILQAADEKIKLVVLPELFSTGNYNLATDDLSEMLYDKTTNFLKELAENNDMFIVGSFIQKVTMKMVDDKRNTTILCGPGGVIGVYDKVFLWRGEVGALKRGNDFEVVETPLGRIGMLTCYDIAYPEAGRALGKKGANIIVSGSSFFTQNTWDFATRARAYENSVYHIAADRVGKDGSRPYCGMSRIVDPMGRVMAEKVDGEGLLTAEIDLDFAKKVRKEVGFFQDDH
jgi:predicted amidohydrolase